MTRKKTCGPSARRSHSTGDWRWAEKMDFISWTTRARVSGELTTPEAWWKTIDAGRAGRGETTPGRVAMKRATSEAPDRDAMETPEMTRARGTGSWSAWKDAERGVRQQMTRGALMNGERPTREKEHERQRGDHDGKRDGHEKETPSDSLAERVVELVSGAQLAVDGGVGEADEEDVGQGQGEGEEEHCDRVVGVTCCKPRRVSLQMRRVHRSGQGRTDRCSRRRTEGLMEKRSAESPQTELSERASSPMDRRSALPSGC